MRLLYSILYVLSYFCSSLELWDCDIPYKIDKYVDRNIVYTAKNIINHVTDFNLVEYTNQVDYISIEKDTNYCMANIGKLPGKNRIGLIDTCGVVDLIHEIFHVVGIDHEQQRHDRDNYIEIYKDNIVENQVYNFDIIGYSDVLNVFDYNYESLMHYSVYSLTKNNLPVMKILNQTVFETVFIGQNFKVSEGDIRKINYLASLKNCISKSKPPLCSTDDLFFFSGNDFNVGNRLNTYFVKNSDTLYFSEYRKSVFLLLNYFGFNIIFEDFNIKAFNYGVSTNWYIKDKNLNTFYYVPNSKLSLRECESTTRKYVFNMESLLIYFIFYMLIPLVILVILCVFCKCYYKNLGKILDRRRKRNNMPL